MSWCFWIKYVPVPVRTYRTDLNRLGNGYKIKQTGTRSANSEGYKPVLDCVIAGLNSITKSGQKFRPVSWHVKSVRGTDNSSYNILNTIEKKLPPSRASSRPDPYRKEGMYHYPTFLFWKYIIATSTLGRLDPNIPGTVLHNIGTYIRNFFFKPNLLIPEMFWIRSDSVRFRDRYRIYGTSLEWSYFTITILLIRCFLKFPRYQSIRPYTSGELNGEDRTWSLTWQPWRQWRRAGWQWDWLARWQFWRVRPAVPPSPPHLCRSGRSCASTYSKKITNLIRKKQC